MCCIAAGNIQTIYSARRANRFRSTKFALSPGLEDQCIIAAGQCGQVSRPARLFARTRQACIRRMQISSVGGGQQGCRQTRTRICCVGPETCWPSSWPEAGRRLSYVPMRDSQVRSSTDLVHGISAFRISAFIISRNSLHLTSLSTGPRYFPGLSRSPSTSESSCQWAVPCFRPCRLPAVTNSFVSGVLVPMGYGGNHRYPDLGIFCWFGDLLRPRFVKEGMRLPHSSYEHKPSDLAQRQGDKRTTCRYHMLSAD